MWVHKDPVGRIIILNKRENYKHNIFMDKIESMEQMRKITDGCFLVTKLKSLMHIQKDDVIHKFNCDTLDSVKTRLKLPKNKIYFHIKPNEESLKKYECHKTCRCFN